MFEINGPYLSSPIGREEHPEKRFQRRSTTHYYENKAENLPAQWTVCLFCMPQNENGVALTIRHAILDRTADISAPTMGGDPSCRKLSRGSGEREGSLCAFEPSHIRRSFRDNHDCTAWPIAAMAPVAPSKRHKTAPQSFSFFPSPLADGPFSSLPISRYTSFSLSSLRLSKQSSPPDETASFH